MLDNLKHNQRNPNGVDGPTAFVRSSGGLANTNPVATSGSTLGSGGPVSERGRYGFERSSRLSPLDEARAPHENQRSLLVPLGVTVWLPEGAADYQAKTLEKDAKPKAAGQVVLFRRIMEDWVLGQQEAATLLGFETSSDVQDIYDGRKPVGNRDANDRLRAILRIAADLDALFQDVVSVRGWLYEAQKDLDGATPRALLQEGSMENLLRVKYYAAHLSGR